MADIAASVLKTIETFLTKTFKATVIEKEFNKNRQAMMVNVYE